MTLLTENNGDGKSKVYMKQIHAYSNRVIAEIIYQDKETEYEYKTKLWYCTMYKAFENKGKLFGNTPDEPTEQNWIDAHKWADEQLAIIQKYGTVKVERCKMISEMERNY